MEKGLFARKGERIICPNRHYVVTFARDVYRNEVVTNDMFCNPAEGLDLKPNALFGRCPRCGMSFAGTDDPDVAARAIQDGYLQRGTMMVEGKWK